MQADQAQVDTQKLNLTYCRIVAPVGGRVGLRQVDPGNYVQTSDANGIVVITQLQPISVIFTLPEDNLPAVLKRVHAGATLQVDRLRPHRRDQARYRHSSTTIDNQIDTTTGTVKLRATLRQRRSRTCSRTSSSTSSCWSTRCTNADIVPELGDPARRARHLCLSGQAGRHGRGAAGDARAERRPEGRGHQGAASRARSSSPTAPTG